MSSRIRAIRVAMALTERLPLRVVAGVVRRGGRWSLRAGGKRENLRRNLEVVLGGSRPDDALVERFVQRGVDSYAQYWAEGLVLPGMSPRTINERFVIGEGKEYLEEAFALGRGVVVALPHIGSWEWGGAHLASLGMGMTAVAERLEPPELFTLFSDKRRKIGIDVVALDHQAGSQLLEVLNGGGVVGLLCDRDIQGGGIDVTMFDRRVTVSAGPATLAFRTGATLVAACCYAGPGRDHYAVISPPIVAEREGRLREDVTRVTQHIVDELAGFIRRAPEQWHVLEDRFVKGDECV